MPGPTCIHAQHMAHWPIHTHCPPHTCSVHRSAAAWVAMARMPSSVTIRPQPGPTGSHHTCALLARCDTSSRAGCPGLSWGRACSIASNPAAQERLVSASIHPHSAPAHAVPPPSCLCCPGPSPQRCSACSRIKARDGVSLQWQHHTMSMSTPAPPHHTMTPHHMPHMHPPHTMHTQWPTHPHTTRRHRHQIPIHSNYLPCAACRHTTAPAPSPRPPPIACPSVRTLPWVCTSLEARWACLPACLHTIHVIHSHSPPQAHSPARPPCAPCMAHARPQKHGHSSGHAQHAMQRQTRPCTAQVSSIARDKPEG